MGNEKNARVLFLFEILQAAVLTRSLLTQNVR